MQEEPIQFKRNDVWDIVPCQKDKPIISTRWVFRDMMDENNINTKNKFGLVAKGYRQAKGIDYKETCALVAHL